MIGKSINSLALTQQILLFASLYLMMYLNPVNDFMRSIGKIWVVVASLLIIFFGIVVFLYFIERRISKLEKEFDNEQQEH